MREIKIPRPHLPSSFNKRFLNKDFFNQGNKESINSAQKQRPTSSLFHCKQNSFYNSFDEIFDTRVLEEYTSPRAKNDSISQEELNRLKIENPLVVEVLLKDVVSVALSQTVELNHSNLTIPEDGLKTSDILNCDKDKLERILECELADEVIHVIFDRVNEQPVSKYFQTYSNNKLEGG